MTNNTDSVIRIGKDAIFYADENPMILMDPITIKNSIKQIVPGYLPYLLLTFTKIYITNESPYEPPTTYPVGLILGPGVTVGNMTVASNANKKLLNELNEYNILNKDIQKGETVYGIIGVNGINYKMLSVRSKK